MHRGIHATLGENTKFCLHYSSSIDKKVEVVGEETWIPVDDMLWFRYWLAQHFSMHPC